MGYHISDKRILRLMQEMGLEVAKPTQTEILELLQHPEKAQSDSSPSFSNYSGDTLTLYQLMEMVASQPEPPESPFYPSTFL